MAPPGQHVLGILYFDDGRVDINPSLSPELQKIAIAIREMTGILKISTRSKKHKKLFYDGISKRMEIWKIVMDFLQDYTRDPTVDRVASIARCAPRIGYFSIWMTVFNDHPNIRKALIGAFKADPACFDESTAPVKKGRV